MQFKLKDDIYDPETWGRITVVWRDDPLSKKRYFRFIWTGPDRTAVTVELLLTANPRLVRIWPRFRKIRPTTIGPGDKIRIGTFETRVVGVDRYKTHDYIIVERIRNEETPETRGGRLVL